jgi:hypothetical protein
MSKYDIINDNTILLTVMPLDDVVTLLCNIFYALTEVDMP